MAKTTLARRLALQLGAAAVLDPFDQNLFVGPLMSGLSDPALAIRAELTFVALRIAQLREMEVLLSGGRDVVADWALFKQAIFAATTLTEADVFRVAATVELWAGSLPQPDILIGLSAATPVLQQRIRRRGRPMEAGITSGHLDDLGAAFQTAYAGWDRPLVQLDTATFDTFDDAHVHDLAGRILRLADRAGDAMTHPAAHVTDPGTAGPPCRRLFITGPGRVELIEHRLPALGAHDVHARTVLSGISHGTETAWLRGTAAALHRTWHPQRFYADGPGRDYPVAPGYESIAQVIEVGPAVTTVSVGDLIAVDAPHADAHLLTEQAAARGRLPDGADPEQAVFHILARVALGGVHDARPQLGETVVVTGLGTVGLLAAQQARHAGATVIGVDRYPLRVQAAQSLGVHALEAGTSGDVAAVVHELTGGAGADAAIEASGSYAALHEAIRCLRPGGRVATVASYHGDQAGLRLGEEYHATGSP